MAKEELIGVLDFILNRCNSAEIDAVAAAIVRRRKDLALFVNIPDPASLAKNLSSQINIEGSMEGLKKQIQEYAIRIIRQEAPELTDGQIEELCSAWLPGGSGRASPKDTGSIPKKMLASMIDQFIAFSLGRMDEEEDKALRNEIGPWPDKYWNSIPNPVKLIITDFLKGEIGEEEFNLRIGSFLSMR